MAEAGGTTTHHIQCIIILISFGFFMAEAGGDTLPPIITYKFSFRFTFHDRFNSFSFRRFHTITINLKCSYKLLGLINKTDLTVLKSLTNYKGI